MPSNTDNPIWFPSPELMQKSEMKLFLDYVAQRFKLEIENYAALHQWSVVFPEFFWQAAWDYFAIIHQKAPQQICKFGNHFQDTQWFLGAELNFAQNLLRYRDDHIALVYVTEKGQAETMTYAELHQRVCSLALYLQKIGVKANDRVAGVLPNCPATVVAMLAATSLGAIWSACSPDFGEQGLLDRFAQIEPKILFAIEGYVYDQKYFDVLKKIRKLQQEIKSIEQTIIISDPSVLWENCFNNNVESFSFPQFPFDHPLYILYSSGTTGKPKCMVHGAGGTLLQHLKELKLHTNLNRADKIFFIPLVRG